MEDKLHTFRQPMVTATGIILGFILSYASSWVKAESPLRESLAYVVGLCVLAGIISLIVVLARMLRMDYDREHADTYYRTTLHLFVFGLASAFTGVIIDMFSHFMDD